jgi:hypothetical protein
MRMVMNIQFGFFGPHVPFLSFKDSKSEIAGVAEKPSSTSMARLLWWAATMSVVYNESRVRVFGGIFCSTNSTPAILTRKLFDVPLAASPHLAIMKQFRFYLVSMLLFWGIRMSLGPSTMVFPRCFQVFVVPLRARNTLAVFASRRQPIWEVPVLCKIRCWLNGSFVIARARCASLILWRRGCHARSYQRVGFVRRYQRLTPSLYNPFKMAKNLPDLEA